LPVDNPKMQMVIENKMLEIHNFIIIPIKNKIYINEKKIFIEKKKISAMIVLWFDQ